jgi:hypothetical protein
MPGQDLDTRPTLVFALFSKTIYHGTSVGAGFSKASLSSLSLSGTLKNSIT